MSQIAIWSNIEPCASVVCACLPTYGPFFRKSSPGEASPGESLSQKFRARFHRSVQSGNSSVKCNSKTTHVDLVDGQIGDNQTKNHDVVAAKRNFAVIWHSDADLDDKTPEKQRNML